MAEPYTTGLEGRGMAFVPQLARPEWYAVQTRPRHEHAVASQLDREGVEVLLPMTAQLRRWSDRQKLVQLPLFPNYVFVRTTLDSNEKKVFVLRRIGVVGFVGP